MYRLINRALIGLLFLSFSFSICANSTIDSLKQVVENTQGEAQVMAQNALAKAYMDQKNWKEARLQIDRVRKQCEQMGYDLGLAATFDNIGHLYTKRYDYTNALDQYVKALDIRHKMQDEEGVATSKHNIGVTFFHQEEYDKAVDNLSSALAMRKKMENEQGMAESHRYLADVFYKKEIFGKSLNHYKSSLELFKNTRDLASAAQIARLVGNIYSELGEYDGALAYYQTSLDINSARQNLPEIGQDLSHVAKAYFHQDLYEEAMQANQRAYGLYSKLDDRVNQAASLTAQAAILQKMGNNESALGNLSQVATLLETNSANPQVPQIYKQSSEVYEKLGDFKAALAMHTAYAAARSRVFNLEKSSAQLELITEYESRFEAEKQKQRIQELEQKGQYEARFRGFLYAMIGLGLLLLMVLWQSYKRKKKDNNLLMDKNTKIQRQKAEIDQQNQTLEQKNSDLDELNSKLVTEMAERENIEKSSFARDRFLATMSHEMRTPINIIIGLTHLLLDENPRENQVEHLRTLQFSANNLVVFINDILDFSKIEAGKLTLENRIFNPKDTVQDIQNRFNLPMKDRSLKFNVNYDDKIPTNLFGDSTRLNQIMTNLVSQCMQSTESGSVDVNMELNELKNNAVTLRLNMSCSGSPENKERVLAILTGEQKFEKDIFDNGNNNELGLKITRRLIELQNGHLEVVSTNDHTTFNILLPYRLSEAVEKTVDKPVQQQASVEESMLKGQKVLLVEDNKINQLVVAKLLRKNEMEVVTANNGQEALEAFENSYFDLVLMDIQMPVMDGYRATAEIRKFTDPQKRDVPIIALTASAFLTEKEKAKLFGMNDHVGKPFGPEDLLEKISKCLKMYRGANG